MINTSTGINGFFPTASNGPQYAFVADVYSAPTSYYSMAARPQPDDFLRVKMNDSASTIFNDEESDPRLKSALAHRRLMMEVCTLIEDEDRKFLSYILNAIVRGDMEMLVQIFGALWNTAPHKMRAYIKAISDCLVETVAGVSISMEGNIILLHIYHGNCAIAIDSKARKTAVVPIYTDWDGSIHVLEGEVISPAAGDLMVRIQQQCVQRVLFTYEKEKEEGRRMTDELPIVQEKAA